MSRKITWAWHSRARRKKAAETECFPAASATLICAFQYADVSSLSNLHLLQFSAVWYGVPVAAAAAALINDDIGVRAPPSCTLLPESVTLCSSASLARSWGVLVPILVLPEPLPAMWLLDVPVPFPEGFHGFASGFSVGRLVKARFGLKIISKKIFECQKMKEKLEMLEIYACLVSNGAGWVEDLAWFRTFFAGFAANQYTNSR